MTKLLEVLQAEEDASVNFVRGDTGTKFEARYVRRSDDYFIAYVSSHAGCDRACRFCHLTATRQTDMTPASMLGYLDQIKDVLHHHSRQDVQPEVMNINFMARGEPLLNPILTDPKILYSGERTSWQRFVDYAKDEAALFGVNKVNFNISTIMPLSDNLRPLDLLTTPDTTIYYSLYSLNKFFRRRWIPKSMYPHDALTLLAEWQQKTGNDVVLHWAFIDWVNDDEKTVDDIIRKVKDVGLTVRFNAVRYNPFDTARGHESSDAVIQARFKQLEDAFGNGSRIVPRVGFSVKASCGMFVQ